MLPCHPTTSQFDISVVYRSLIHPCWFISFLIHLSLIHSLSTHFWFIFLWDISLSLSDIATKSQDNFNARYVKTTHLNSLFFFIFLIRGTLNCESSVESQNLKWTEWVHKGTFHVSALPDVKLHRIYWCCFSPQMWLSDHSKLIILKT